MEHILEIAEIGGKVKFKFPWAGSLYDVWNATLVVLQYGTLYVIKWRIVAADCGHLIGFPQLSSLMEKSEFHVTYP